jgi:hypothetical protein
LAEGRALPALRGVLIDEFYQLELLGEIVESGGAAKLGETRPDGFGLWLLEALEEVSGEPRYCRTMGLGRPFTRRDSTR